MSNVKTDFICKCGKQKGWIGDGEITTPCPLCGRVYIGEEKLNKETMLTEITASERLSANNVQPPQGETSASPVR